MAFCMMVIRGWPMPDYPKTSLQLDDLKSLLMHISPDLNRDEWWAVTAGLKSEFGEEGFDAWEHWSKGSKAYDKGAAESTWKSTKAGKITIGTVIHLAKEGGWRPEKKELTAAERRQQRADDEARRKKRQAEIEADEQRTLVMHQAVQGATMRLLSEFTNARGKSEYLARKQVDPFGVRFISKPVVLSIDDELQRCDLWTGDDIKRFFDNLPNPRPDSHSFMMLKPGTFLVPLADVEGVIWSFQSISPSGTKLFPKHSRKSGCMHCIGSLEDAELIVLAEGYSTTASCFMATEWAAVMTVDVGNMAKIATALHGRYPRARLILAGDDDPKPDGKNPGRAQAEAIGRELGVVAVFPRVPVQQVAA